MKGLENYEANHVISNLVIYHKLYNGEPNDFYAKVYCNEGEIKEELVSPCSVPLETSPSIDFYTKEYKSLKALFDEVRKTHRDYVSFKDGDVYSILTTAGSIASYFREVFYTFPYFDFTSPEVECGKTTAMKAMLFTSFYGTVTSSFSEAVMFREIDASHCAYGLDNIERLFTNPKDYVSIIDWLASSYSRDIPCKRLEKRGDNWIVVYYDGYGIKAFTHVKDFPYQFRALKSRTIQILMQKGKPNKFYPTPDKFADIRDRLYHARIREHKKVKETYEQLVKSNILTGRVGDLYYPLLTIAQLVDEKEKGEIFQKILAFTQKEEQDRREYDVWNKILINTLYEEGFFGSVSSQDIKPVFRENLEKEGLITNDVKLTTQSVSSRLKKLGFERDAKKRTENKTWFTIDAKLVDDKCYEYGIKSNPLSNTPQTPNFSNFSNIFDEHSTSETEGERSTEGIEEEERSSENEYLKIKKTLKSEKSELKEGGYEKRNSHHDRLEALVRSFVIDVSKQDERGVMVVAMINHFDRNYGYGKEEVKEVIDRMIEEGNLIASIDECGEFVKVAGEG